MGAYFRTRHRTPISRTRASPNARRLMGAPIPRASTTPSSIATTFRARASRSATRTQARRAIATSDSPPQGIRLRSPTRMRAWTAYKSSLGTRASSADDARACSLRSEGPRRNSKERRDNFFLPRGADARTFLVSSPQARPPSAPARLTRRRLLSPLAARPRSPRRPATAPATHPPPRRRRALSSPHPRSWPRCRADRARRRAPRRCRASPAPRTPSRAARGRTESRTSERRARHLGELSPVHLGASCFERRNPP
jgi:hypothetical protein